MSKAYLHSYLITNARMVNEGEVFEGDILIRNGRIDKIGNHLSDTTDHVVDLKGAILIPGLIDDQVHFREPGLTHKANIASESKAAVAGGITSFMEMPNTVPQTVTQELLEDKYAIGASNSMANYSFYMGATNDNLAEVLKTDPRKVCGVKIFMGSSTGNMLVDDRKALEGFFGKVEMLIATHCEDEETIQANTQRFLEKYGENIPISCHPEIRSREACYRSSSMAIELAKQYGTRLHVLHISTAEEVDLFENSLPLAKKNVTSEACIHHLWFEQSDYDKKGTLIKWNPAVKTARDRERILRGVREGHIDVLATDHAPHTLQEKQNNYLHAPSGGPLVQHSLVALMELVDQGKLTLEELVQKACHNPAILFRIKDRGFIREGYHADLVAVSVNNSWTVEKSNILAKCGWSPFEGHTFQNSVSHTWISGYLAYENGEFSPFRAGERLLFEPNS